MGLDDDIDDDIDDDDNDDAKHARILVMYFGRAEQEAIALNWGPAQLVTWWNCCMPGDRFFFEENMFNWLESPLDSSMFSLEGWIRYRNANHEMYWSIRDHYFVVGLDALCYLRLGK